MTGANDIPAGGFPKSIHGYNIAAVDDYVLNINDRMDVLLAQAQTESGRADQSRRLLEQMTTELDTMRQRAAGFEKREALAAEAQKRAEEEVARLVLELKETREKARTEAELALADARLERNVLMEEERQDAEALIAEARRSAATQVAEAQRQVERLQNEAARMAAELEILRAVAANAKDRAAGAMNISEPSEARHQETDGDLDSERLHAREQIDHILAEVRRSAEEATASATSIWRDQQERMRELAVECEELMSRVRAAVEMPPSPSPSLTLRSAANGSRTSWRAGEADDQRIQDNREWRNGDWRTAS